MDQRALPRLLLNYFGKLSLFFLFFFTGCDTILSNDGGNSSAGAVVATPTGVYAAPGTQKGTIIIHWDSVKEANSYNIYSATTPGVENNKFKSKKKGVKPPFTFSGLTSEKPYFFTITAANGHQESAMSAEVSTTAP